MMTRVMDRIMISLILSSSCFLLSVAACLFILGVVRVDALSITTTTTTTRSIVWFRSHALRTRDNDALREALSLQDHDDDDDDDDYTNVNENKSMSYVVLLDDECFKKNGGGGGGGTASQVFTVHALNALNQTLQGRLDVIGYTLPSSIVSSSSSPDPQSCTRIAHTLVDYIQEEAECSSSSSSRKMGFDDQESIHTELFYLEGYDSQLEERLQEELSSCYSKRNHSNSSKKLILKAFRGSQTLLDYTQQQQQPEQQNQHATSPVNPTTIIHNAIAQHSFASPLIPFVDFVLDTLEQTHPMPEQLQPQHGDDDLTRRLSAISLNDGKAQKSAGYKVPRLLIDDLLDQVGKSHSTNWGESIIEAWPATEATAQEALDAFIRFQYDNDTDLPHATDDDNTQIKKKKKRTHLASRVSPYLARGLLSPRQVYQQLQKKKSDQQSQPHSNILKTSGSDSFLRRIAWRDYAYAVSCIFPKTISNAQPIRAYDIHDNGNDNPRATELEQQQQQVYLLKKWKQGKTGFPLVDAGMRQLIHEGFMPQQVRLAVAACLVEGLNVPWKAGMQHFAEYLVDYDVVINTQMWMNAGGVGLDPYYIGLDYKKRPYWDADGRYVRHWCPELTVLPDRIEVVPESAGGTNTVDCLYTPWKAPDSVLCKAGVVLGETYPIRICDEREGRRRFLESQRTCRASWIVQNKDCIDDSGNDIIDLGQGVKIGTFTPRSLKMKPR